MNSILPRTRPAEILLAEDNENDVELTRLGFQRSKLVINLHCVENGEDCMKFLRKQENYSNVPTPDLLLLDLNMPRMGGQEVMEEIVADAHLRRMPVVILTSSEAEKDILKMYDLRCSSYIVKPIDFGQFVRVIQSFSGFWLSVVVLPTDVGQ